MFADEMDILTLTRWRLTCKSNYRQATSSLRRSLTTRLDAFVPYSHKLVDIVTEHRAVFGGEFALSFILRDDTYQPNDLEIFASDSSFENLCAAVLDDQPIRDRIERRSFTTHTLFNALRRLVARTLLIKMTSGRTIHIHQSYTASPSAPITRVPCTALSNFVTAYGFGCSHPRLTLDRRALLADQEVPFMQKFDDDALKNLEAIRFSLEVSPAAWPEYSRSAAPDVPDEPTVDIPEDAATVDTIQGGAADDLDGSEECWRHIFICPSQGRYFGDVGSFVDYFDPLDGAEALCVERNIAPFGPMMVWRVMSTFDCAEGCDLYDDVLDEGVTSIPVLFKKDPYSELRDLISDRYIRTSIELRSSIRRSHSV